MTPITMLWKFPGCTAASVWELAHVDGDLVFLSRDDRLATVAIDLGVGTATLTVNDSKGARTRTFDTKENLCHLVEVMVDQFLSRGPSGPGVS